MKIFNNNMVRVGIWALVTACPKTAEVQTSLWDRRCAEAIGLLGDEHGLNSEAASWLIAEWTMSGPVVRSHLFEATVSSGDCWRASQMVTVVAIAGRPEDFALLQYVALAPGLCPHLASKVVSTLGSSQAPEADDSLVHLLSVGAPDVARLAVAALGGRGTAAEVYCPVVRSRRTEIGLVSTDICGLEDK